MKNFKAFSLAEVLITMMVIAVIAAMTIPTLRKDANNKAIATNLKKIYSELNQASSLFLTENYSNKMCRAGISDDAAFEEEFINKKLNVVKKCTSGASQDCFGDSSLVDGLSSYVLNSGISISFDSFQCPDLNLYVYVDVNGPNGPNRPGSDQFLLMMNDSGKVYTGSAAGVRESGAYDSQCETGDDYAMAWACAAKIQQDGWTIKY